VELGIAGGREWRKPTTLRSGSARDYLTLPIRVIRTFVRTAIGVYLARLIGTPMLGDLADITLIDSAAAAGIVAVLTFAHNALEDWRDVDYKRG
jgi:hypothetical protein